MSAYDDHRCEVSKSDLSSLDYDCRRRNDDLENKVNRLELQIESLKEEVSGLWEAINTLSSRRG